MATRANTCSTATTATMAALPDQAAQAAQQQAALQAALQPPQQQQQGQGGGGGGSAGVPAAGGAALGVRMPLFALHPSQAIGGLIDYGLRQGQYLYQNNSAPLSTTYDLDSSSLLAFLKTAQERAESVNWSFMLQILTEP